LLGDLQTKKNLQLIEYKYAQDTYNLQKKLKNDEKTMERKKLALEICEKQQQKNILLQIHRQQLEEVHLNFELRKLEWMDIKKYKEEEKEKSKKSIALRLESWRIQKLGLVFYFYLFSSSEKLLLLFYNYYYKCLIFLLRYVLLSNTQKYKINIYKTYLYCILNIYRIVKVV
jgi:hypothetical protein